MASSTRKISVLKHNPSHLRCPSTIPTIRGIGLISGSTNAVLGALLDAQDRIELISPIPSPWSGLGGAVELQRNAGLRPVARSQRRALSGGVPTRLVDRNIHNSLAQLVHDILMTSKTTKFYVDGLNSRGNSLTGHRTPQAGVGK